MVLYIGKMALNFVVPFLLLFFGNCAGDLQNFCPNIFNHIFKSYTPIGDPSKATFTTRQDLLGIYNCTEECCKNSDCNVVFVHASICYHVQCNISDFCLPLYQQDFVEGNPSKMVLVRPANKDENWLDIINRTNIVMQSVIPLFPIMDGKCNMGLPDCPENEVCVKNNDQLDASFCECVIGFKRNAVGVCEAIRENENFGLGITNSLMESEIDKSTSFSTSEKPSIRKLMVSTTSKEVRLPENSVTLSAFTLAEQENEHFDYAWKLLSQPEGHTGTMKDQNRNTVQLENLSEGQYKFKVTVSNPNSYGEAYANVSVLPPKRINKAPIAIITPDSQIVKLPNNGAVLDGSASKDDDKIISYHWELQQGPIGYQPNLVDTPMLQLQNLTIPGNYTFKLTVEDSDHVSNSTTANITVLKVTDYPPSANAGQDVIIYLPQNTVTLNGNLSSDDHHIASWEWTKSPSDENKAVDMQNTRTPYLQLSNLEEGMYTFVLKVTDDSNQFSKAEVRVFVKPPTHRPPKADAGENVTMALPLTQATLNGSKSKSDSKIVSYNWEQISGPSNVQFTSPNDPVTNVTKLTKGDYTFKLTVADENGNKDSVIESLTVTQNKNAAPVANAGGDQTIIGPVTALVINGSQSSDDFRINQWLWTRDPSSLAIGSIVEESDKSPVLILTHIVPGRYVFTLKVTDDQGLSSEDTVSVILKPDPQLLYLVELTLNVEAHHLTESQKNSLVVKLEMLIRDEVTIVMRNLKAEPRTNRAILVFYVQKKREKTSIPGLEVVKKLKEKLHQDSGILQLSVASVTTAICQNNCSGHGVCDEASRRCMCEAFWMQNFIKKYYGSGDSNCDWSLLYVTISLVALIVGWIAVVWGIVFLCQSLCFGKRRSSRSKKKPARYSLLQPEAEDERTEFTAHKMVLSDSDSDSDDVLFEHRKGKINGYLKPTKNEWSRKPQNGSTKSRIKA